MSPFLITTHPVGVDQLSGACSASPAVWEESLPSGRQDSDLNLGPLSQVLRSKVYNPVGVYSIYLGYAIIPACLATKPTRREEVVRIFTGLDFLTGREDLQIEEKKPCCGSLCG
jgi:hypothetical protein